MPEGPFFTDSFFSRLRLGPQGATDASFIRGDGCSGDLLPALFLLLPAKLSYWVCSKAHLRKKVLEAQDAIATLGMTLRRRIQELSQHSSDRKHVDEGCEPRINSE